ncbi:pre-mRNA-processing ATP-dependent RNA helicase PRP5, putative [Plasmodium gallinaceum]|uniref:RNA helicase n=1 Tax=Plasmodium gallinaceum TaxID=5849 RepID=A0A1J1GZG5_PLAGA|nr:pre-mRNA-processing ATP-dependent RNA helicase PRP5, putative [Plasmodium gallinaceum]CRG97863.1 pre-mRNA-processing ATP-dependent RNA helicase PRP5, putative [Plasmodium gallinaceum]
MNDFTNSKEMIKNDISKYSLDEKEHNDNDEKSSINIEKKLKAKKEKDTNGSFKEFSKEKDSSRKTDESLKSIKKKKERNYNEDEKRKKDENNKKYKNCEEKRNHKNDEISKDEKISNKKNMIKEDNKMKTKEKLDDIEKKNDKKFKGTDYKKDKNLTNKNCTEKTDIYSNDRNKYHTNNTENCGLNKKYEKEKYETKKSEKEKNYKKGKYEEKRNKNKRSYDYSSDDSCIKKENNYKKRKHEEKKNKKNIEYVSDDDSNLGKEKNNNKRKCEKKKKDKRINDDHLSTHNKEETEEEKKNENVKNDNEKEKGKNEDKEENDDKNSKLSRLERLKLFAEKIKKEGNEKITKCTKFTLNTTNNNNNNINKKCDIDVFMLNQKNNDRIMIEKNISVDENISKNENHVTNENDHKNIPEENEDSLELFMKQLEMEYNEEEKVCVNKTITLDEINSYNLYKDKFENFENSDKNEKDKNKVNTKEVNKNQLDKIDVDKDKKDAYKEDDNKEDTNKEYMNEKDTNEENENKDYMNKKNGNEKYKNKEYLNKEDRNEEENIEKKSTNDEHCKNDNDSICKKKTENNLERKEISNEDSETFDKHFIEELKKKTEEDMKKSKEKENKIIFSDEEVNESDKSNDELSDDSEFNCETNSLKKINKKLLQVNHEEIDYLPIKKNIYVQVSEITNMKESDVEMFRKNNGNIIVRGKNCPRPVQYFYQCGLPSKILPILEKKNFKKMFNIQMQTIPALMCGRDIIAIAETGSGKTLSYLLPLIRHVLHQHPLRNNDGPIALILTPTRELSIQVKNEAKIYCKAVNLNILAVYGGSNIGKQLNTLKRGVEILVGTPGRIIDILTISNCKVTNLNRVSFVVLDEADRLLDLGFETQIYSILNNCRKDKQTAMISATFPNYIQNMAKKLLYKPIEIIVGEKGKTNNNIYQFVEVMEESKKIFRLLKLLGEWINYGLILIFVNKQLEADLLYLELFKYDYKTLVLHGGQDQADREFTLQNFKDEQNKILIATSVMARGIDIKNIILVINYECPDHIEDYIHRIGRTGRSNNIGYAYTFISPNEHSKAYDIYNLIKNNIYYINKTIDMPQELEKMVQEYANTNSIEYKKKGYKGKGYKFTPNEKSRLQIDKALAKKELGLVEENNEDQKDYYSSDNEAESNFNNMNNNYNNNANINNTKRNLGRQNMSESNINQQNEINNIELEIQRIKMNDKMDLSLKAKKIFELMKNYNFDALQNSNKNIDNNKEEEIEKMAEKEALKSTQNIKDEKEKQMMFNKIKEDVKKKLINNKNQLDIMNESIQRNMILNMIKSKNLKKYSPYLPHTYITEDNNILEEFYINDYPQHVRLKISHRDVLSRVSDISGASCQIKGQYYNPSQSKKNTFLFNVKQLHIEITASTYNQVQIARNEFNSLINVFMQKCNTKNQKLNTGYNVFH